MNGLLTLAMLLAPVNGAVDTESVIESSRARIEELQHESGIPGVQVAVALDGELVWFEGLGWRDLESRSPVTEDTRFGIGSITKTLTMVVCARLVDRGRLAWGEPVETYLEDFPHSGVSITVRRIGAHLSGMGDVRGADRTRTFSIEEAWRRAATPALVHPPGEAHLYATSTFTIVAASIEVQEGRSFAKVVSRELTEPLGLRDTVPHDPNEKMPARTVFYEPSGGEPTAVVLGSSHLVGGTGYLSTARDLVLLGHAVINTDFVSEPNRKELLTDQRTNDGKPTFFGLGWRLGRTEEWGFFYGSSGGGSGIAASLLVVPKYGVTVATVTNLTRAPAWPMTLETAEAFAEAVASVPGATGSVDE